MIDPTPGTDITLGNRSDATARFNFVKGADGDVSFDDTEGHAVMTSATEDKGGYWADPNHGNEAAQLKSLTSGTPSQAEAMTTDAEAPLVQAGSIENLVVTSSRQGFGKLVTEISWMTPGGTQPNKRTVES